MLELTKMGSKIRGEGAFITSTVYSLSIGIEQGELVLSRHESCFEITKFDAIQRKHVLLLLLLQSKEGSCWCPSIERVFHVFISSRWEKEKWEIEIHKRIINRSVSHLIILIPREWITREDEPAVLRSSNEWDIVHCQPSLTERESLDERWNSSQHTESLDFRDSSSSSDLGMPSLRHCKYNYD